MPANELAAADLLARVATSPMAIAPGAGEQLVKLLHRGSMHGISAAAKGKSAPATSRYVAGLSLYGALFPHSNFLTEMGFGTALDKFVADLKFAASEPAYSSIIVHVDSPGGSVYGVEQAALALREVSRTKKVVAVVDGVCASGAYWIASNAPSARIARSGALAFT